MESGNRKQTQKYIELIREKKLKTVPELEATIFYIAATFKREDNFCEDALHDFDTALKLAETDWLKNNLLRNMGLAYLKEKKFLEAKEKFQEAYDCIEASVDTDLRGALPALANYVALSTARAELALGQKPTLGLIKFAEVAKLYKQLFSEKGVVDEVIRRQSHDYISHCVHRATIICETYEMLPTEANQEALSEAITILTEAFKSRVENKADGQRLGDVCESLGRAYDGLQENTTAKGWYDKSLGYYKTIFTENDGQIRRVRSRLLNLSLKATLNGDWISNSVLDSSKNTRKQETEEQASVLSSSASIP